MALAQFIFSETSPSAPGTAASSQAVQNAASYLPAGVAGPTDEYESIQIDVDLKGATGGTLDVYLQASPDAGMNWYDIVHWTQLGAGAAAISYSSPISQSTTTSSPITVGKNLSPALAAGTVVNGAFSDRMRLVMVAGSGTSIGAAVVVRLAPQRMRAREMGEWGGKSWWNAGVA